MTREQEERFIASSIRNGDGKDFFIGRSMAFDHEDEDFVRSYFTRIQGRALITSALEAMAGWRYQRDIIDAAKMLS